MVVRSTLLDAAGNADAMSDDEPLQGGWDNPHPPVKETRYFPLWT